MKATIQKKRLIGAMNEFLIRQNEFVCLLSMITGKQNENEQNCFTTKVQKITQLNSIKLNNILKAGIQKDLILKSFSFEKDYISYLSQIKDKNICLNFIKYKSFSLEKPRNDLDAWFIDNNITQKKIFSFTTHAIWPILLPNLIKNLKKEK